MQLVLEAAAHPYYRSRQIWQVELPEELVSTRSWRTPLTSQMLPNFSGMARSRARYEVRLSQARIALALMQFERDQGYYPEALGSLILDAPSDVFSGDPLHYESDGETFLLYSVGVNGVDQQGHGDDVVWGKD